MKGNVRDPFSTSKKGNGFWPHTGVGRYVASLRHGTCPRIVVLNRGNVSGELARNPTRRINTASSGGSTIVFD